MPASSATADLQIINVPIDELRPDPANPSRISHQELDALTRSLREFGFLQPVIARRDARSSVANIAEWPPRPDRATASTAVRGRSRARSSGSSCRP